MPRRKASAVVVSPDEPATRGPARSPVETAEGPEDMFRATEGRWGSREIEITDVHAARQRRRSRRTSSTPATR